MKILILSDLHLDKPRGNLKIFDIEDAEEAIKSLAQFTADIDAVIIAGDVFNAVKVDSIPLHLLSKLNEQLKDIPQKFAIRGNHDRARFPILEDVLGYTALKPYENIEIAENLTISGCDFADIDTHKEYLSTATSDILVCHFPMAPFSTFGDLNLSVNDCPEKKVVIVGDTHKPEIYSRDNRCVISPGCLFPADRTELLSGYAGSGFILDIDKIDGELSIGLSQIWLSSRFGYDLSSIKTKDELVLGLKAIEAEKGFITSLKPVAYVDATLVDSDYPGFVLLPAPKQSESGTDLSADFSGLDGEDIDTRIRRILSGLYKDCGDTAKLVELTMELISTDDTSVILNDYIASN